MNREDNLRWRDVKKVKKLSLFVMIKHWSKLKPFCFKWEIIVVSLMSVNGFMILKFNGSDWVVVA